MGFKPHLKKQVLINVPQFIDVEDKIVGPLTGKQLGWMIALGVFLVILWKAAPFPVFVIVGIPIALLISALAFYKPYGQPLGGFIIFGIMFFFRPKIYFWKRPIQTGGMRMPQKAPAHKAKQQPLTSEEKKLPSESLEELADLLDSQGMKYNKEIEKILKQPPKKNLLH